MENIFKVFEGCKFQQWTVDSLQDVNIPASSKDFLLKTGLPVGLDWSITFDPPGSSPLKRAVISTLRIIGKDAGVADICIDEKRNGQVVALEPGDRVRPINSSVVTFAKFLALYQRYRELVKGMGDHEAFTLIDQTETDMGEVDKDALSDVEGWWPAILEQMREGNL